MKGKGEDTGAGGDARRDADRTDDGGGIGGLRKRFGSKFRVMLEKRGGKDNEEAQKEAGVMEGKEDSDTGVKGLSAAGAKGDSSKPGKRPDKPKESDSGGNTEAAGKGDRKPDEGTQGAPDDDKPEGAGSRNDVKGHSKDARPKKGRKPVKKKGKHGKTTKDETAPGENPVETMSELIAQKDEVEALLSSIEDAYREATLPDKTYQEVRSKNENKLKELEDKIKRLEASGVKVEERPAPQEAPVAAAAQERPVVVTGAARPEAPTEAAAQTQRPGIFSSVPVLEDFEKMVGDRMKDVITAASLEMTDKRIKKVDDRISSIESELKDLKKAGETVAGFDKQFTKMNTEVEKSKALVESMKEAKNVTDDKIQRMMESFAEIRSIVYQREAQSKEQEVVFDKLKDAISQVDSARILREFTTRDEQMRDVNTRIERLERSGKMLSDTMNRIKGLMTDIGSLENIMKGSKLVGEKLERIQEIEERMKAASTKLDGLYVELRKRLDEFNTYRVRQDKTEGMLADIMKNMEDVTRRLSDYATRDDMEVVKQAVSEVKEQAMKAAKSTEIELPPEAKMLQEEKEEIETLLSTLEENLRNKDISEEEFNSAKTKNLQRIREIDAKIASYSKPKAQKGEDPAATGGGGGKRHSKAMMLAKLQESYKNGEISRRAYEKSKRMLLKK
ncbi:MAG: hypothetical protein JXC85_03890 [Candidatus Aenigmarchaeota archaeon]|nr:hypothetical protein [Candidatus Aenigmarchaeota archaeon]